MVLDMAHFKRQGQGAFNVASKGMGAFNLAKKEERGHSTLLKIAKRNTEYQTEILPDMI